MSITGPHHTAEHSEPFKVGSAISDVATGMYAVIGIIASLYKQQSIRQQLMIQHLQNQLHNLKNGNEKQSSEPNFVVPGEHVDICLFDASLTLLVNQALNYLVTNKAPVRLGNAYVKLVENLHVLWYLTFYLFVYNDIVTLTLHPMSCTRQKMVQL